MRSLSMTPASVVFEALADALIAGQPLRFGMKQKLKLALHACNVACKTLASAPVPPPPIINNYYTTPPTTTTAPKSDSGLNEVAFDGVVGQGGDLRAELMTEQEFFALKRAYVKRTGGDPTLAAQFTIEQASVFKTMVEKKNSINYDLSVLVPFADRNMPRRKLNGTIRAPTGELITVEIYGPANFYERRASWFSGLCA